MTRKAQALRRWRTPEPPRSYGTGVTRGNVGLQPATLRDCARPNPC